MFIYPHTHTHSYIYIYIYIYIYWIYQVIYYVNYCLVVCNMLSSNVYLCYLWEGMRSVVSSELSSRQYLYDWSIDHWIAHKVLKGTHDTQWHRVFLKDQCGWYTQIIGMTTLSASIKNKGGKGDTMSKDQIRMKRNGEGTALAKELINLSYRRESKVIRLKVRLGRGIKLVSRVRGWVGNGRDSKNRYWRIYVGVRR